MSLLTDIRERLSQGRTALGVLAPGIEELGKRFVSEPLSRAAPIFRPGIESITQAPVTPAGKSLLDVTRETFVGVGEDIQRSGAGMKKMSSYLIPGPKQVLGFLGEDMMSRGRTAERIGQRKAFDFRSLSDAWKRGGLLEAASSPGGEDILNIVDVGDLTPALAAFGILSDVGKIGKVEKITSLAKGANEVDEIFDVARKTGWNKDLTGRLKTLKRRFMTEAVDRLNEIRKFENLSAKELATAQSPYKRARLYAGVGGKVQDFIDTRIAPAIQQNADRLDDFEELLKLERMKELSERGLKTQYESKTINKRLQDMKLKYSSEEYAQLREGADQIRDALSRTLDMMRSSGIISRSGYKAIKKKNNYYVPFEIADFLEDQLERGNFAISSFNVAGQDLVRTIKGSEKEVGNVLEATLKKIVRVHSLVDKNIAGKKLVNLRRIDPDTFGDLIKPAKGKVGVSEDVISVMENGNVKKYRVPIEVAEAWKNLDSKQMGLLEKVASYPASVLRTGATGLNPAFIPTNIVRDVADAMFTEFTQEGVKGVASFLRHYPRALVSSAKMDDLYRAWLRAGGAQSSFIGTEVLRRPSRAVGEMAGQTPVIKKVIKKPKELVEFANRVGEESTRLAKFSKEMEKGTDFLEAAYKSRNITIDFAKGGHSAKAINRFIPFFNAGIQGTARITELVAKNPKRAALASASLFGIPALILYNNNKKFEDWNDIPQYERNNNWVWIYRDRTPEERAAKETLHAVKIPKGRQAIVLANMVENFVEWAHNQDAFGREAVTTFLADSIEDYSPVGFPVSEDRFGRALARDIPTMFLAPAEQMANKRFFTGAPIVPPGLEGIEPREQYDESTPAAAVVAGQVTGISPKRLEAGVEQIGAGLGEQLLRTASGEMTAIPEEIAGRFTKVRGGRQTSEAIQGTQKEKVRVSTEKKKAQRVMTRALVSDNPKKVLSEAKASGELSRVGYEYVMTDDRIAKVISDKLNTIKDADKRKEYLSQAKKSGIMTESIYGKVQDKLDLSAAERYLKGTDVPTRAARITKLLERFESEEEKVEYLSELKEKKILTKTVYEELVKLRGAR